MTIATSCFYYRKKEGKIRKGPMVGFRDGMAFCKRRAWVDIETGEITILLNGNAHTFTPWEKNMPKDYLWMPQEEGDYICGHI